MDPLSLAVSIIAITGAIKATGKGIVSLRKIRDGPKELACLLSETDELHDVLLQIQSVVDHIGLEAPNQQDAYRFGAIKWIKEQLDKANVAVAELDRLGLECSKTSNSGQIECSRRKWQKNRSKATTLLSDVQSIRGKLLGSLAIINLWVVFIPSSFSAPSDSDSLVNKEAAANVFTFKVFNHPFRDLYQRGCIQSTTSYAGLVDFGGTDNGTKFTNSEGAFKHSGWSRGEPVRK